MFNKFHFLLSSTTKHICDGGSVLIVAGTSIFNALPNISAGLAAIWFSVQIGAWIYSHIKKKRNDDK